MIEARNIVKTFGKKRALDGLSLTVRKGVAFGLLGRNGAGKTTTIRILMHIFREDSGTALIDGIPAWKEPRRIGYLPEERGLYAKRTVIEQLIYFGKLKGLSSAEATKASHEKLTELEATEYTSHRLETLSKGNQQKIQLAVALLGEPDIVILDEPFSGLDPINAQILKSAVRRQVNMGKTVIFSSHQMAQVEEFCDDICIMDHGRAVLEGNLAAIKRSYPRNRLYVAAEATPVSQALLEQKLSALSIVKEIKPREVGFIVTIDAPENRTHLLRALDEADLALDNFSVIEPTLEQIFVEKASALPQEDAPENIASHSKRRSFGTRLFGRRDSK
jgi:ABC-2 type transport system ATP-binding protein